LARSEPILPLSFIDDSFFGIGIGAFAVTKPIEDLAFVVAAIRPIVTPNASDLIVSELSLVFGAVHPGKLTLAVEQPVLEFSFEGVTFSELTGSLSMIHFAYL
jgi:hypothetical protein